MTTLTRRENPLVLLVEDDVGLREAVVRGLTKAGYLVAAAATGREAVRSAKELTPDAVVMDVGLPGGGARQPLPGAGALQAPQDGSFTLRARPVT